MLLSVGHTFADILDYTLSQFTAFCKSAEKQKRTDHATFIHGVATGAQGDGKGIKKAIEGLTDGTG